MRRIRAGSIPGPRNNHTSGGKSHMSHRRIYAALLLIGIFLVSAFLAFSAGGNAAQAAPVSVSPTSSQGCGSWSVVNTPDVGTHYNNLWSVSAVAADDAWAVGFDGGFGSDYNQTLAMHWDGTQW